MGLARKTLGTAVIGLQTSLIYKNNFIMGFITGIISLTVQLVFWPSFYGGGTDSSFATIKETVIGGYYLNEIMTYSLVVYFIQRGNSMMNIGNTIKRDIMDGGMNILLIRPINYLWSKWIFSISGQIINTLLSFVVFLFMITMVRIHFVLPGNIKQVLGVLLFSIFANLLSFLIHCIIGLLSFWILETSSISMILNAAISILSGAIFPLNYINNSIFDILKYLPFSYLVWFPTQIYLNKISPELIYYNLLICIIWIMVLLFTVYKIWITGIRKYAAFGG